MEGRRNMKRYLRLMSAAVAGALLLGPVIDRASAQGVSYAKIGNTSRPGHVKYAGDDRRFESVGGYKYRRNKYKKSSISTVGRRAPLSPAKRTETLR